MSILLCDPHTLFTEALKSLLEERGYDVATCSSPCRTAEIVRNGGVDIVITGLTFPGPDGEPTSSVSVVRSVTEADRDVRVIVLTEVTDINLLQAALAEGAVAVTHKVQPLAELFQVIERVQAGEAVLSSELMRAVIGRTQSNEQSLASFLTTREREVLGRLVQGQSTRQIAESMGVAYSTARTHIQSVLDKLGVHSRLEAAAFAARHQVVFADPRADDGARADA